MSLNFRAVELLFLLFKTQDGFDKRIGGLLEEEYSGIGATFGVIDSHRFQRSSATVCDHRNAVALRFDGRNPKILEGRKQKSAGAGIQVGKFGVGNKAQELYRRAGQ